MKDALACTALKRPGKTENEWLLCTGTNMGRWTTWFGPWNLAGDAGSKEFVETVREMTPGSTICEFAIISLPFGGE